MRWLRRNLITAALGLLVLAGGLNAAESLQLLLADTTVNHVEQGEAFLLWDGAGDFYVPESELVKWRVQPPFPKPVEFDDKAYYRVHDLPGATAQLDMQAMVIAITLPPEILRRQHFTMGNASTPRPSSALGAYLDYDLSYMDDSFERYPLAFLAPDNLQRRRRTAFGVHVSRCDRPAR